MKKQPSPKKNKNRHVADELIKDIKKRKAAGLRTYGTALQPHNGRDALQDLYEELIDACCYIKQYIMESKKKK